MDNRKLAIYQCRLPDQINSSINSKVPFAHLNANGDFNNLTTRGMYRIQNNWANRPQHSDYDQVLVVHGGADTIAQMVFNYESPVFYFRTGNTYNNSKGTWQQWTTVGRWRVAIGLTMMATSNTPHSIPSSARQLLVYYGTKNGGQIYAGGSLHLIQGISHPTFVPLYNGSTTIVSLCYFFWDSTITVFREYIHAGSTNNICFAVFYR